MRELVGLLAQILCQARVRDGDRALVGKALEQRELVLAEGVHRLERDRQGPDHLAARRAQRRGRHAAQPHPLRHFLVVRLVRDARVDEVVLGRDDRSASGGEAVDPAVDREVLGRQPLLRPRGIAADGDGGPQGLTARLHQRQVGAVGADEPARGLDHRVQDLAGLADDGDAGADLAQRSLRVDATGQLLPRAGQLLDQPLVGDRARRVVGERPQQRDLRLVEVVDPRRVGPERAEHLAIGDERRGRHGAHVRDHGDPVGDVRVGEALVAPVVARHDHLAGGDGVAEEPDADRQ